MNIVKLSVENKLELAIAYMSQLKFGGIFIKDNFDYDLDDNVFIVLEILETGDKFAINGNVVWVSPEHIVGYPTGIGIQFTNDKSGAEAKIKIERMLGGLLQSRQQAYTF